MPTHTKLVEYQVGGARIAYTADAVSADGEVAYEGTIVKNTADNEIDLAFDYADVKACSIYATTAMVVETNSTTVPDDTFTLAAGEQLAWTNNETATNPFTANVTKFYVTNSDANNDGTLKIHVLLDVTP